MRVDACVNSANVLAAWADVEQETGDLAAASQLLVSSVEGYRRALEQEEDAAVMATDLVRCCLLMLCQCTQLASLPQAVTHNTPLEPQFSAENKALTDAESDVAHPRRGAIWRIPS